MTGAAGFICGYLVAELLRAGHEVVGVDNFSKYGPTTRKPVADVVHLDRYGNRPFR